MYQDMVIETFGFLCIKFDIKIYSVSCLPVTQSITCSECNGANNF